MNKGDDIHKDQAGVTYDPFDYINEFIIPINVEGSYCYYQVHCPVCKKEMYKSNEPCRLLPLRPCIKCSETLSKKEQPKK